MQLNKIKKLPPLIASHEMIKAAKSFEPKEITYGWNAQHISYEYKYGVYIQCQTFDNSYLKIAFFLVHELREDISNARYELVIKLDTGEFKTYDSKADKWLDSMLFNLEWPEYKSRSGYYVTACDKEEIQKHLGLCENSNGRYTDKIGLQCYDSIAGFQQKYRNKQLLARHKKETAPWDEDMSKVPPVPKDFERWVSKQVIEDNYIFYNYSRKKCQTGYCTYCEKEVPISGAKHNIKGICPCCKRKITFKADKKAGYIITSEFSCYLLQKHGQHDVVIRRFTGKKHFKPEKHQFPEIVIFEHSRAIFRNGSIDKQYYFGNYKQRELRWILREPNFEYYSSLKGMIYPRTMAAITKNLLSRTGLGEFYADYKKIDAEGYLGEFSAMPIFEQICKAGLTRLAMELLIIDRYTWNNQDLYRFKKGLKEITGGALTKAIGINHQQMKRMVQHGGGFRYLTWLQYENNANKPVPDECISYFDTYDITPGSLDFIKEYMSPIQIYHYLKRKSAEMGKKPDDVLTTWQDYLSMAQQLHMDISDEIIYKPNKLGQRHAECIKRLNDKTNDLRAAELLKTYPHIQEALDYVKSKYEYGDNDYTVIAPRSIVDILVEGQALQHCVGKSDRYFERIQNDEAYVLFLRKTADIGSPYYTLEVEPGGTIRQKRTKFDRQNKDIDKATKFLEKWQKEIIKRLNNTDIQKAKASAIMRNKEFDELQKRQKRINFGDLQGELLYDILAADLMIAPTKGGI